MEAPIILSVSELTYAIKAQLEPLFRRIWVRGEITNCKRQSSGHIYFTLIEGGCQLSAAMFRADTKSLLFPLKDGENVVVEGEIDVYAPRGSYQIIVRKCSHVGIGDALVRLQALKKKLHALGWFSSDRKRPLPSKIRTIGIVTSPTGAVLHDIINVLTRRLGGFRLLLNPVRVQGDQAAFEIARAIQEFNAHNLVDIIVVCRGGGSAEDLNAYNEEIVARACVESAIPIVAAIGHETDLSIADLVADLRAPTPSAAAELISHERSEQLQQLIRYLDSAKRLIYARLTTIRSALITYTKRLEHIHPKRTIEHSSQKVDEIENALTKTVSRLLSLRKNMVAQANKSVQQLAPFAKLIKQRSHLQLLEKTLSQILISFVHHRQTLLSQRQHLIDERVNRSLALAQQRFSGWKNLFPPLITKKLVHLHKTLTGFSAQLQSLSPQRVLERGYSIVFHEKDVIRSIDDIHDNDQLSIMVSDGRFDARVTEKKK